MKFSGYSVYRNDGLHGRTNGSGGVALLVRNSIVHSQIINLQKTSINLDCIGVDIHGANKNIKIILVYRKPGYTEKIDTWKKLLDKFSNNSIIMMDDFNAHNTSWNCYNLDKNGSILAEECDECGLVKTRIH